MISPAELKAKMLKRYPQFLKELVCGESLFPYRPRVNLEVDYNSYSQALAQIRALEENAKPHLGYGYTLKYKTVGTRKHGPQSRPRALSFETAEDLFAFIDKGDEANRLLEYAEQTRRQLGLSDQWLAANLALALRYLDRWPEILRTVLELRELSDIPALTHLSRRSLPVSLDTKFIERHRTPIQNILDELEINSFDLERSIYPGEMLFWLRFLESRHSFFNAGVGIFPVEELARMDPPANRVLVIENKASFIQGLPEYIESLLTASSSMVTLLVWGQGNACLRLKEVAWLAERKLYYWGDMDLYGLAILGRFRKQFPDTKSLGMDLNTYKRYSDFTVPGESLVQGSWYEYLTGPEKELADYLVQHPDKSRLEQERIR